MLPGPSAEGLHPRPRAGGGLEDRLGFRAVGAERVGEGGEDGGKNLLSTRLDGGRQVEEASQHRLAASRAERSGPKDRRKKRVG